MATKLAPAHRELDGQPIKTGDVDRTPKRRRVRPRMRTRASAYAHEHARARGVTPEQIAHTAWLEED